MNRLPFFDRKQAEAVTYRRYIYKKNAEYEEDLTIAFPEQTPKGCLFFIHGGGWRGETRERLQLHANYASLCGGVGVSVSYRLLDEKNGADVRDGLTDCADALAFVRRICREKYGKDLLVTAIGDSAGGYYANCLGSGKILRKVKDGEKRVDYVADLNGIVDLTGKWGYGIIERDSEEQKEELEKEYSPLYNVEKGDAPVLIVHGARDKTVDLSEAKAYFSALRNVGVEAEMIELENAAHAFILFDYHHDNGYVAQITERLMNIFREKGLI